MDFDKIASRIASETRRGTVRTAGTIEFKKDSGPVRRDVRVHGFKWSSDALRDLAKILWASQRAHSYAMAALRIFSKMPSSEFSPDGLLGGRGYIQSIREMRTSLSNTVETLSSFTDTVHDEVNADHWAPAGEAGIDSIVADADEVKENPESFVEQEFKEENYQDDLGVANPEASNPEVEDEDEDEDEDDSTDENSVRTSAMIAEYDGYAAAFDRVMKRVKVKTASSRTAGGALDELPFQGPEPNIVDWDLPGTRVRNLGPGDNPDVEQQILEVPGAQNPMVDQELLLDNGLFLPFEMNPTDGDDYRLSAEGYSQLPGADNSRSMNWYELGLTDKEMAFMKSKALKDEILEEAEKDEPKPDRPIPENWSAPSQTRIV